MRYGPTDPQKPRWPDDWQESDHPTKVHFSTQKKIGWFGFGWFGSFGVSDDPIKVPIIKSPRSLHGKLLFLFVPIAIYIWPVCVFLTWNGDAFPMPACLGHPINPMLDTRVKLPDQKGSSFLFFKCYLFQNTAGERVAHVTEIPQHCPNLQNEKNPPNTFWCLNPANILFVTKPDLLLPLQTPSQISQ